MGQANGIERVGMGTVAVRHGAMAMAREWFKANPGEYLTVPDMVAKFGFSSRRTASQTVHMLKQEGLVKSAWVRSLCASMCSAACGALTLR